MKRVRLKLWKRLLTTALALCIFGSLAILSINFYVKQTVKGHIVTSEEALQLGEVDCILILGCGVRGNTPSPMLEDRLQKGLSLFELQATDKLLMSGDHGKNNYNEVAVMKQYAIDSGVASQDVFMDHAGFSTYESMYRAKEIFCAKKIIIVTQAYHLSRALYIANALGLDAYGVAAEPHSYSGQAYRDLREYLARSKDFFTVLFSPKPSLLGETIPVSGNGDSTND